MNYHEVLKRFCADEEDRPKLGKPWIKDGHTIATDGRILIRLFRELEGVEPQEKPPSFQKIIDELKTATYGPLPDLDWTLEKCVLPPPKWTDCKECEGRGEVLYDYQNVPNGTYITCPLCEGEGRESTQICEICRGRGYHCKTVGTIEHKGNWLNPLFVAFIADLPGVEIQTNAERFKVIGFRFDYGDGGIMSMRAEQ